MNKNKIIENFESMQLEGGGVLRMDYDSEGQVKIDQFSMAFTLLVINYMLSLFHVSTAVHELGHSLEITTSLWFARLLSHI